MSKTTIQGGYAHVTLTFTTVAAGGEADFILDEGGGLWELEYHGFSRSAGDGATYKPIMGETTNPSGETARMSYSSTITNTTVTQDSFDPPIPFKTDSSGKLYYRPVFASGTNNTGVAILRFRKVGGAPVADTTD